LYINKIIAEKKVDLSTFIKDYKEGLFNEIKVINDKTLKGYHFVKTGQAITSMGLREKIIPLEYEVYTTEKPVTTSLKDLGIVLTGNTAVIVKYEEE
jgi:hypothetical protein